MSYDPKFCTNCRRQQPVAGGQYKVFAKGLNRRWLCAECVARKPASWFGKGKE